MTSIKPLLLLVLLALMKPAMGLDCRWDKDRDYPQKYPPLVMDVETWLSVLPRLQDDIRIVHVEEGRALIIACPETTIVTLKKESVEAVCVGGKLLLIDGKEYSMAQLECTKRPKESLQKNKGACGVGGELHYIGFDVAGFGYYPLVEVCFDHHLETTLYTSHTIRGPHFTAKDTNPSRPSFRLGGSGYFSVSPNNCYYRDSQSALMDTLLQNASAIDISQNFYFSRGHLAPDADFFTEHEADATYYYINCAPQWAVFNNGNWKYLEEDTRSLASALSRDLHVWTGCWEVLLLDDVNDNAVEIFLGVTEGKEVIPAPSIMWKVLYDPKSNEAAAVIGVNNPHIRSFPTLLCEDVCDKLNWLDVDQDELRIGATYCCTVQDLRKAVPNVPDLENAGLLVGEKAMEKKKTLMEILRP